jgi:hypothetical protein
MTTTTLTGPRHQELINILTAAGKPLTSKQLFAQAKGFESQDDISKCLNYLLKKGVVEREKTGVNTYSYWPASTATAHASDSGNTLLRHGGEEPMPDQPEQPLATVPASAAKQIINDALKPCPEIDATTREMADQAEIAYQILSEALGLTPEQMSELTLADLATAAAARLDDQPPPADVAMLASANRELSMRMAKVIAALHKAPVPFADAIDNDHYLVSNVETIVAELIGEQVRASELQEVVIGLRALLDQVRHALDLSPAASSMDILAEIENLSRLTDRAIQYGARDAVQGPYIIISDPRGCAGIYETIDEAKKHAARMAYRTTTGRAAIVQTLAEVTLVPQWSDEA